MGTYDSSEFERLFGGRADRDEAYPANPDAARERSVEAPSLDAFLGRVVSDVVEGDV